MIHGDQVVRIYQQVALGITKEESSIKLNEEMNALWDQIAIEVRVLSSDGFILDVPFEMPDPVAYAPTDQA